jgi:hypothetical protein
MVAKVTTGASRRLGPRGDGQALSSRDRSFWGGNGGPPLPRLRTELYDELIPDYHYVAVNVNVEEGSAADVVRGLAQRYRQTAGDQGYLDFVAANAMAWYDPNVRMPASLELTIRLLGLEI